MKDSLKYLLALKENSKTATKECAHDIPFCFYETYCAMANSSGGAIYLGISEGEEFNKIVGVENAPQIKKQLCNSLTNKSKMMNNLFDPSDILIINTEFGDVVKVIVKPVAIDQRPVYLNGDVSHSFKRVDEGDKYLDENEIQAMINDSSKKKFDQKPNDFAFGINDLDQSAINDFIARIKNENKILLADTLTNEEILSRIGALVFDNESKNLVLTNGAVLFFGKSYAINSICPSLWMDYQEKSTINDRFSSRITNKDLITEPNIYNFYSKVYKRLLDLLPTPFYLERGVNVGKRFVEEIAREALANAISNLDLFSPLGLSIIKTPNTLTIKNAGGVLTGIEQALKGGVSIPRNPCIFNFFLSIGIVDHGGYCVPNIFSRMKELKMPVPDFKESISRNETSLFLSFREVEPTLSIIEQKTLAFISLYPEGISSSDLAKYLDYSTESARKILVSLEAGGHIVTNEKIKKGKLYFLANN